MLATPYPCIGQAARGAAHPYGRQAHVQGRSADLGQPGLGQALPGVAGQGVADLVGHHRGQVGVTADVLEQAGINAHLPPRQTKGIGHLVILEDHELPVKVRPVSGPGDALPHLADPGLQGLVGTLGGLLLNLRKGLVAQGLLPLRGHHEHLFAPGIGGGGAAGQGRPQKRQPEEAPKCFFTP